MARLKAWHLLAGTHLAAGVAGYAVAPRELLETEVKSSGFFRTDTKRVLSAAVESLRAENRLLVYTYKGVAAVSVERDGFLFLDGRQDLIVPAAVGYYVDLSGLEERHLSYHAEANLLTVRLPPLVIGDVAFEPEGARTRNGGPLTFDQGEADELGRLNYAAARRAFVKSAQSRTLIDAAKREARWKVERLLELPLRAARLPHVRVSASSGP